MQGRRMRRLVLLFLCQDNPLVYYLKETLPFHCLKTFLTEAHWPFRGTNNSSGTSAEHKVRRIELNAAWGASNPIDSRDASNLATTTRGGLAKRGASRCIAGRTCAWSGRRRRGGTRGGAARGRWTSTRPTAHRSRSRTPQRRSASAAADLHRPRSLRRSRPPRPSPLARRDPPACPRRDPGFAPQFAFSIRGENRETETEGWLKNFQRMGRFFLSPCLQLQSGTYLECLEVVGSWKILNF